jgi:NADH:ubiquinone reductase (H+-translocating)
VTLHRRNPHVAIIGAGYAGLPCALSLSHNKNIRVSLINPDTQQELTCDLYRTLRSGKPYLYPFSKTLARNGVRFIEGNVTSLDPIKKTLDVRGLQRQNLAYDALVIASGLRNVLPPIDGLEELMAQDQESLSKRIFQFKKLSHAQSLRAALSKLDWRPDARQSRDHFVVILGAGSTGLEVAGEIAHLRGRNRKCRIVLVDEASSLLRDFSPVAQKIFKRTLHKLNIETVLGSPAKNLNAQELLLENGQVIPWDLLVLCTGSKRAPSWTASFDKVSFSAGLSVNSHFELDAYPLHYVIGDLARYTLNKIPMQNPRLLPKRAQFAMQAGQHVAKVLPASLGTIYSGVADLPEFKVQDLGYLITLGPREGIGRLGPQPQTRAQRWISPFIQGSKVDALKNAVRIRYLLTLRRLRFFR